MRDEGMGGDDEDQVRNAFTLDIYEFASCLVGHLSKV